MRSEPRKLRALAPRGKTPRVIAERHEKYEPRIDMWGAITYSDPLTCETLTSQQRKKINNPKRRKRGGKGYETLSKKISQVQTSSQNQTIKRKPHPLHG